MIKQNAVQNATLADLNPEIQQVLLLLLLLLLLNVEGRHVRAVYGHQQRYVDYVVATWTQRRSMEVFHVSCALTEQKSECAETGNKQKNNNASKIYLH